MLSFCLVFVFTVLVAVNNAALPSPLVGAYFPNWAQYRPSPATFTPSNLSPVIEKLNVIWYGFAYFCPDSSMVQPYWVTQLNLCNNQGAKPFELIYVEPKDPQFYQQIEAFKTRNRDLKVIISIGGWNFPSNFWSGMVANKEYRTTFINSCLSFMSKYGFDGVDLDWEFPGSPAREDEVKITCYQFDKVVDEGGSADDGANFAQLVKEMRAAFGSNKYITIATQADMTKATMENIKGLAPYVDMFDLMSYDYTVSDIPDGSITAPNQPLYPPDTAGVWNDSTSVTIDGYIAAGINPKQVTVGISYYGHLWYVPGLKSQSDWCKFGLTAQIQGQCCGPMQQTYGAKYGKYSQLCGTYMYSETQAAGFDICFEPTTKSNIGYMSGQNKDGYTAQGVWISYQDKDAINATISYAKSKGLAGAFAFDISMDTKDFALTTEIHNLVTQ